MMQMLLLLFAFFGMMFVNTDPIPPRPPAGHRCCLDPQDVILNTPRPPAGHRGSGQ